MNREALIHQLISIRAGIDACLSHLIAEEEQKAEKRAKAEAEFCWHPKDRRENLTVMGGPNRWRCKDCGGQFEGEP